MAATLAAFTASLFVLLPNNLATCFRAKPSGFVRHISTPSSRRHRHDSREKSPETTLASSGDGSDIITTWEDRLREEATDALLPVFFPKSPLANDDDGSASLSRADFLPAGERKKTKKEEPVVVALSAEVALKRLLRKRYQRRGREEEKQGERGSDSSSSSSSDPSDDRRNPKEARTTTAGASRGRLAALILGTSVMRLRHFYEVATTAASGGDARGAVPIPYPLDSFLDSSEVENIAALCRDGSDLMISSDERGGRSVEDERLFVRAMVDGHARYLTALEANPAPPVLGGTFRDGGGDATINLSVRYSLPPFLASSLLSQYGRSQTERICSVMNGRGPITIRRNAIRFPGSSAELCERLREEDGVRAEPLSKLLEAGVESSPRAEEPAAPSSSGGNRYAMGASSSSGLAAPPEGSIRILPNQAKSIWSMNGWKNGYFEVQDAGSQLIVQSLEVEPGESVLDYCAGNGGKTFALASAVMESAGATDCVANPLGVTDGTFLHSTIVAHDVVEERLRQIKGSLSRVGFEAPEGRCAANGAIAAETRRADRKCTLQTSSDLDVTHNDTRFDAVLVDAPCSSTGVLRRRPSQRWDLTEEQVFGELPQLQSEILERAATFAAGNGGRLVYSTCSLLAEENEDVARGFEESRAFADLGFEPWDFVGIDRDGVGADDEGSSGNMLTLLPSETGSDGFFIARWKRRD